MVNECCCCCLCRCESPLGKKSRTDSDTDNDDDDDDLSMGGVGAPSPGSIRVTQVSANNLSDTVVFRYKAPFFSLKNLSVDPQIVLNSGYV